MRLWLSYLYLVGNTDFFLYLIYQRKCYLLCEEAYPHVNGNKNLESQNLIKELLQSKLFKSLKVVFNQNLTQKWKMWCCSDGDDGGGRVEWSFSCHLQQWPLSHPFRVSNALQIMISKQCISLTFSFYREGLWHILSDITRVSLLTCGRDIFEVLGP